MKNFLIYCFLLVGAATILSIPLLVAHEIDKHKKETAAVAAHLVEIKASYSAPKASFDVIAELTNAYVLSFDGHLVVNVRGESFDQLARMYPTNIVLVPVVRFVRSREYPVNAPLPAGYQGSRNFGQPGGGTAPENPRPEAESPGHK